MVPVEFLRCIPKDYPFKVLCLNCLKSKQEGVPLPITAGYTNEADAVCDAILDLTCKQLILGVRPSNSFVSIFLC